MTRFRAAENDRFVRQIIGRLNMNRRTNALMTTVALVVMLAAAGQGQGPAPFASVGKVDMSGDWSDDPENFSGAVIVGNMLLIGSDEIGYLQVGRDKDGTGARFERSHEIELAQKKGGKKVEVDFEALAADKNTVYALGSHSLTRKRIDRPSHAKAAYKDNVARFSEPPDTSSASLREKLFRFELDPATGKTVGAPKEISLRAIINAQTVLKPFSAIASKEGGIDLEGLAADGVTLFAGFRGPVLRHGFAPVMKFTFDNPNDATLVFVPLDGRGIRDLAKAPDGILVLAGPAGDSDQSHRLYRWNGQDCIPGTNGPGGKLEYLGEVPTEGGKAEALVVNSSEGDAYVVTFFYDSLPAGGPQRFRVPKAGHATASTQLCGFAKS
jgi:Protein of unknown function (DUF3616)